VNRWTALACELGRSGVHCAAAPEGRVAGGSVSECYVWPCEGGALFVKVGPRAAEPAFAAEAAGLAELARAQALRVPRVMACGRAAEQAFLALEWIKAGPASVACERRLGEGLALLHAVTAPCFGWRCDNTIGPTPQANGWSQDWTEFFRERRLRPQLVLATQNGLSALAARGERLLESMHALLRAHRPAPSLLHGDLWGGNWLASESGEPVIFDPAVYYGDREADIAMTRLFGGFGEAFHHAYQAAAPLPPGTRLRQELYNLYHVLNHANLFGGGYPQQASRTIDRLLAEVRG
jgi:protein-ribulosamine 3-kinase